MRKQIKIVNMKRPIIFSFLILSFSFLSNAQDSSFWPSEVKHIPGLDVEIFDVDKSHSKLNFSIGLFGFTDVDGAFNRFGGTVLYNENDLEKTSISLVIDASSISTNSSTRDKDLNKEDFFDTENHRLIRFETKRIERKGKKFIAIGDLIMKGITKELRVPFERTKKRFIDPFWSNLSIGFKGELTLNRMDFNIHGGRWGDKVLSDEVKIEFAIVAKQPNTFKFGTGEVSAKMTEVVETIQKNGVESGKTMFNEVAANHELDNSSKGIVIKRLVQKYNFEEAIAFSEFILEKFPDQAPRITRDMAKAYMFLEKTNKAIEIYSKISENNPLDTEAREILKKLK